MRRWRHLSLVVVLLAGLAVVPLAATAAGCATTRTSGRWLTIDPMFPIYSSDVAVAFGRGSSRDTLYAFHSQPDPGKGREVLRSTDYGCSWQPIVSLDRLGTSTDLWRLDPAYRIVAVAVAQAVGARPPVVYAVAGDDGYAWGVALPTVSLVSTDGGAHWTVHQPTTDDLAGDYPRCSRDIGRFTRLTVTTDPSSLFLFCRAGAIEGYELVHCSYAMYVSHDGARTWTPSRGRDREPDHVTEVDNGLGCGRTTLEPRPSAVTKGLVWDRDTQANYNRPAVMVSKDDGHTFTVYGRTTTDTGAGMGGFAIAESRPGARPLAALTVLQDVYLANAAGAFVKVPRPKPAHGKTATVVGVQFLRDQRGAWRLLVAYNVENPAGATAFLLDPATRRWQQVEDPPRRSDLSPAWKEFGPMTVISAPGVRTVYFATGDNGLVRFAG